MAGGAPDTDLPARIRSLEHQLEVERANCRQLEQDKRILKQACVSLQQHAEQDEEYISNALLKRIKDLEREKARLEAAGEDTQALHYQLERLRREKVELENRLEQESEYVVNKMAKEKERLLEKNHQLEEKLQRQESSPAMDTTLPVVRELSEEILRLRQLLISSGKADSDQVARMLEEHQQLREENLRLHRKLQYALDKIAGLEKANLLIRAQAEMDDERQFNMRRSVESSRNSSPAPLRSQPPASSPCSLPHHLSPHSLLARAHSLDGPPRSPVFTPPPHHHHHPAASTS